MVDRYLEVRGHSHRICAPLKIEDYVVQPIVDVSPPKWHLAHTTWFFETFVLKPFKKDYREFDADYSFVFNSYYEAIGERVKRPDRGNLTRPTVEDVYNYRKYVDEQMVELLQGNLSKELQNVVELGLQHEQQHQELLWTDIKYILGNNPLFPAYSTEYIYREENISEKGFVQFPEGIYEIGYKENDGFFFDNEKERHKEFLNEFSIRKSLVSNEEYLAFINSGGYKNHQYWHSDGWAWVRENNIEAPMYWYNIYDKWYCYTYQGIKEIEAQKAVCHVNFYEASAFATWKAMRLPTEAEWEVAAEKLIWGERWEWMNSAYLPYPGFKKADGAIGEYNGKFMVNQQVLRGASVVTSPQHSRITYRNFFQPNLRWQFTGIRLAK
ncbi:ergothioneine biosynthesis protein EgtB [Arachidicoccus sp.]|uniref:ergothioneine biosynthesis protein EgtB n=1 Tax=Arachidicoccus sp. TaxID=1872624 RepID=UPI003D199EA0